MEVASGTEIFLKSPIATDTEENTCLSICQAGKKKYPKNRLRRLHVKYGIHAESEVN